MRGTFGDKEKKKDKKKKALELAANPAKKVALVNVGFLLCFLLRIDKGSLVWLRFRF